MTLSGDGSITGLVAGGLPDATVTQPDLASGVAGNGPAFSAFQNTGTNQSLSALTNTKIVLNLKTFDTNNNFDNVTNYRFTPTVAGYYQVNFGIRSDSTSVANFQANCFKNGSLTVASGSFTGTTTNSWMTTGSGLIFLNGSTDYLELFAFSGNSIVLNSSLNYVFFSGYLARAA
jgi:hypothetical protein